MDITIFPTINNIHHHLFTNTTTIIYTIATRRKTTPIQPSHLHQHPSWINAIMIQNIITIIYPTIEHPNTTFHNSISKYP